MKILRTRWELHLMSIMNISEIYSLTSFWTHTGYVNIISHVFKQRSGLGTSSKSIYDFLHFMSFS